MDNSDNRVTPRKESFDKASYTKVVWAGRRRYFFDVLSTKGGEKYLSITESRKKINRDGSSQFENQKLFLFKEDFNKFADALTEVLDHIRVDMGIMDQKVEKSDEFVSKPEDEVEIDSELEKFTKVEFEFESL